MAANDPKRTLQTPAAAASSTPVVPIDSTVIAPGEDLSASTSSSSSTNASHSAAASFSQPNPLEPTVPFTPSNAEEQQKLLMQLLLLQQQQHPRQQQQQPLQQQQQQPPQQQQLLQRQEHQQPHQQQPQKRNVDAAKPRTSNAVTFGIFAIGIVIVAIVVTLFVSTDRGEEKISYARVAEKRTSNECMVVTEEELLAGAVRRRSTNISLSDLAASLRYHAKAHDWGGMCAQHLVDVLPLCYCVLQVENPETKPLLSSAEGGFVTVTNMYVWDESDGKDTWKEITPFCGEQYVTRPDAVRARYQAVGMKDGERVVRTFNPLFEDDIAVTVQSLDDLMYGADLCISEPEHRLYRRMERRMERQMIDQKPRIASEKSASNPMRLGSSA